VTATCCNSLIFETDLILNTPPTFPASTLLAMSELLLGLLQNHFDAGKLSCLTFPVESFLTSTYLQIDALQPLYYFVHAAIQLSATKNTV
jgi:hypothetical protein